MQKKAALKKKLSSLGVDGILITDLANLRYLSGFTGSSGFSIITKRHAIFVTDFRYQEQARREVRGFSIKIEVGERAKEIKKLVDEYKIKKLGFEEDNLSYGFYSKLIKCGIKLKPLKEVVESVRVIKSSRELSYIRTAIQRAERAFRRLQPYIKEGATEKGLAIRLEGFLKEEGCKRLPFEVIVASGSMSALPHARPTNRALRGGDLVIFDWGGECEGYYSDMTRTVLLRGKDISRQCEIYSHVFNAQENAIKEVKAGINASAIDSAVREHIKSLGYGDYFGHGTGHGVGLTVHEKPVISWKSKDLIDIGMVFTIEPGIYIPNFGGVRIEDMVVVRKKGVEVLTSLSRELKIIET